MLKGPQTCRRDVPRLERRALAARDWHLRSGTHRRASVIGVSSRMRISDRMQQGAAPLMTFFIPTVLRFPCASSGVSSSGGSCQ